MPRFAWLDVLKSRDRREREQRAKARETIANIGLYVRRMATVRARFHDLLTRAVKLKDDDAVDANARVCASLGRAISRAQSLALAVESLDSLRDMVRINAEFVGFMGVLSRTVADASQQVDVFSFQLDVETCLQQVEDLSAQLNQAMDGLSPALETFGNPASEQEVERLAREAVCRHLTEAQQGAPPAPAVGGHAPAARTPESQGRPKAVSEPQGGGGR